MALLVGYDSSDEEEETLQTQTSVQQEIRTQDPQAQASRSSFIEPETQNPPPAAVSVSHPSVDLARPGPLPSSPAAITAIGPTLPRTEDDSAEAYPEEMEQDALASQPDQPAPSSPYSASRSLIHTLTLPPVPNMDIPLSPPSSPSQSTAQAALTVKFDKFLELKRKKGTHFNVRIAESHALKNPPLMDKLLDFVGLGAGLEVGPREATEQYATTLPTELWDPAAFPEWAYRGPLRKSQEKTQKEQARERGEAVQFVPASS
ncbi:hypothetical protein N0V93_000947 [Gnomoniopsis smithogilvyi]|uniref:HCNGP-like protein n=1 Tax=Gnomoniopsis smithogilvyi TaxID=1191159 RepID=A0A9W9D297_9PEZI|nr:hypothetical protein N0V93_000947 [Gnomoniopsis smithogilvyi]